MSAVVDPAQDQTVRCHEVRDSLPLGKELRVHTDAEPRARPLPGRLLLERQNHLSVVPGTTVLLTATTW